MPNTILPLEMEPVLAAGVLEAVLAAVASYCVVVGAYFLGKALCWAVIKIAESLSQDMD